MRIAFSAPLGMSRETVEHSLKPAGERFGMKFAVADASRKPKIVLMVSKFDHAMLHLLYQIRVGWLNADVVAIVSNHEDSRGLRKVRDSLSFPGREQGKQGRAGSPPDRSRT